MLQLTQSPFQLGIVGALEFVPFLLFGLIVGVYADRWDRRRILLVADLVRFVVLASVPVAAVFHLMTLAQLYLVAFIAGTARMVRGRPLFPRSGARQPGSRGSRQQQPGGD